MSQNTPTRASVAASATAVTLFAAIGVGATSGSDVVNRTVYNDSVAWLYIGYGAAVTTTDFSYKVAPETHWEAPAPVADCLITGIWSSATGSARCTEVLA